MRLPEWKAPGDNFGPFDQKAKNCRSRESNPSGKRHGAPRRTPHHCTAQPVAVGRPLAPRMCRKCRYSAILKNYRNSMEIIAAGLPFLQARGTFPLCIQKLARRKS